MVKWQSCTPRLYDRLFHQLRKSGVRMERSGSFDWEQTWYVMDVPLLKSRRAAPREHWYNPDFAWDFNRKAPIDFILPLKKKRNPPKLDKVVVRYAERVFDDLIKAINSGKLKGKALYVSPPGACATRGEWQYALQWENRKIDLIVDSRSIGGQTFVPNDTKKPIRIVVKGWETPSKSMFIHEFVHYLQSKHGLLAKLEHHASMADYLDHPNERDAYFVQFLSEEVLPKLRFIARVPDPAIREDRFQKMFGTKKAITARVANYFKASGHWKEMKPQTQKHYIDRLTEYIKALHR